jgi:transcriptional regulator with XRE-family HTH domain
MEHNWIKAKRMALGLSQKELAQLAKVSQATITRLENGERLSTEYYVRVKEAINNLHYSMGTEEYLRTSISKGAEELKGLDGQEAIDVLSHLIVHCGKLIREINNKG